MPNTHVPAASTGLPFPFLSSGAASIVTPRTAPAVRPPLCPALPSMADPARQLEIETGMNAVLVALTALLTEGGDHA